MRRVVGSLGVVAMAWGLAGCGDQAPKSSVIPADKLAQVVLEVPGMT